MKLSDWLTILAIFLGPITALLVQRELDAFREIRRRRIEVFRVIWATRSFPHRLNYRHVEALNSIVNDFAGKATVIEAWNEYLDALNSSVPENEAQREAFWEARDERFYDLVFQMSRALGYKFTRLAIKRQSYSPLAHGTWAEQETTLREGVSRLFKGEFSLPIRITGEPASQDTPPTRDRKSGMG